MRVLRASGAQTIAPRGRDCRHPDGCIRGCCAHRRATAHRARHRRPQVDTNDNLRHRLPIESSMWPHRESGYLAVSQSNPASCVHRIGAASTFTTALTRHLTARLPRHFCAIAGQDRGLGTPGVASRLSRRTSVPNAFRTNTLRRTSVILRIPPDRKAGRIVPVHIFAITSMANMTESTPAGCPIRPTAPGYLMNPLIPICSFFGGKPCSP